MKNILNQILSEQKKQTKLLQTIASSQERIVIDLDEKTLTKLAKVIHDPVRLDLAKNNI